MSGNKSQTQSAAQAGAPGEAAGVGPVVGGVRSNDEFNWLDLWALNPETRSWLRTARRDAACSHASSRREGVGDGSPEIATPQKLRHLQDTLYRQAKARPDYRFWSLYGELTRRDLLEHALRLVVRNGGAPGVSPLFANLYLNALDWAVNDPKERGQPVLVRYADDFVILCAPGQGEALRQRLARWLAVRGLKLNEAKTRLVDSRQGFDFLGFRLRWQPARVKGRWYAHVEASPRSQQRLREAVRARLNHWTLGKRIPEVMRELNRLLRGWGGYFHYGPSSRVMSKLNGQVHDRVRRWRWRKHGQRRALWSAYPDARLRAQYGLWPLPTRAAWKTP